MGNVFALARSMKEVRVKYVMRETDVGIMPFKGGRRVQKVQVASRLWERPGDGFSP